MTARRRWLGAAACAALILAAVAAFAADRRMPVDPNQPPWNAVARVQTNIGGRCTGVLVAPAVVLTAAHCLYNRRTCGFLQPVSLHVLFGFERDQYRLHRLVTRTTIGPGFDGRTSQPRTADWVRLELTEPVPAGIAPLPLFTGVPQAGAAVMLAGYNRDRSQLLMADTACAIIRVLPQRGGGTLLLQGCAGTYGTSGGPLLVSQDGKWAVLGINIGAGPQNSLALAAVEIPQ